MGPERCTSTVLTCHVGGAVHRVFRSALSSGPCLDGVILDGVAIFFITPLCSQIAGSDGRGRAERHWEHAGRPDGRAGRHAAAGEEGRHDGMHFKYPHPTAREKITFVLSKSFRRSWKE
jgi:hypothetical protein